MDETEPSALEREYRAFLARNGLRPYDAELTPERNARLAARLKAAAGPDGIVEIPTEEQLKAFGVEPGREQMTFHAVISAMAAELEQCVRPALGCDPPGDVYAGEYPTGSFNALASPVPGGTLVLVNTGAMAFISKLYRLMIINIYEHVIGENVDRYSLRRPELVRSGESRLSVEELISLVASCVFGYVLTSDALSLPPLPILANLQRVSHAELTVATERFMIAHEYGHAVAGHLDAARTPLFARDVGGNPVYQPSWDEEFEADRNGLLLVLEDARRRTGIPARASEHFAVTGMLLFFELDHLVSSVALHLDPAFAQVLWLTHPPAEQRAERARALLRERGLDAQLPGADEFTGWMRGVTRWTSALAEGIRATAAASGLSLSGTPDAFIRHAQHTVAEFIRYREDPPA